MARESEREDPAQVPVIRVSGAEDVIAYVPHALGFHPEDSLVLISLRPPRGRLGLTVRTDLEAFACSDTARYVDTVAGHLRADGAREVFCVLYVDGTVDQARRDGRVRAARAALRRSPRMPQVRESWLVTPTGYTSLDCRDPSCCPPQGRSLEELQSTRVAAELALRGSAPKERRTDLAPPRSSSSAQRRSFAAAYLRATRELLRVHRPVEAQVLEALETLTGPVPAPPALGRLAALLDSVPVRDAVLLSLASTDPDGEGVPVLSPDDPTQAARWDAIVTPGGPAPDLERIEGAIAVLTATAALAKPTVRADLCAVLAWLSWWRGDGASASIQAMEACSISPDQSLARLVEQIVGRGMAPGWARGRASA